MAGGLVWNPVDMMLNQKLNIANVAEWKPLNVSTFEGASLVDRGRADGVGQFEAWAHVEAL